MTSLNIHIPLPGEEVLDTAWHFMREKRRSVMSSVTSSRNESNSNSRTPTMRQAITRPHVLRKKQTKINTICDVTSTQTMRPQLPVYRRDAAVVGRANTMMTSLRSRFYVSNVTGAACWWRGRRRIGESIVRCRNNIYLSARSRLLQCACLPSGHVIWKDICGGGRDL